MRSVWSMKAGLWSEVGLHPWLVLMLCLFPSVVPLPITCWHSWVWGRAWEYWCYSLNASLCASSNLSHALIFWAQVHVHFGAFRGDQSVSWAGKLNSLIDFSCLSVTKPSFSADRTDLLWIFCVDLQLWQIFQRCRKCWSMTVSLVNAVQCLGMTAKVSCQPSKTEWGHFHS